MTMQPLQIAASRLNALRHHGQRQTHEGYIRTIADIAIAHLAETDADAAQRLRDCKLVYGAGEPGLRGVTYFNTWVNGHGPDAPESFVEICAFGESDPVQLAGTTIHELGHVLAGHAAGHGPDWSKACQALGLRKIKAAGTQYIPAMFAPAIREAIYNTTLPQDGAPHKLGNIARFIATMPQGGVRIKPCSAGHGTRGGKSRGKGSGSRMLKLTCEGCAMIIRTTRSWLDKSGAPTCGCGCAFHADH